MDMVDLWVALFHHPPALLGQLGQHRTEVLGRFAASTLRRSLGIQTTWYLHSNRAWSTLFMSSIKASWDCVSFERFTAQEALVFSRNCYILGVARRNRCVA
jgi:hypothetical protein